MAPFRTLDPIDYYQAYHLKKSDGKRNVESILTELKLHFGQIRADIEEAMEYQVLSIKQKLDGYTIRILSS